MDDDELDAALDRRERRRATEARERLRREAAPYLWAILLAVVVLAGLALRWRFQRFGW